jgi:SAM-dependent methyltransferase
MNTLFRRYLNTSLRCLYRNRMNPFKLLKAWSKFVSDYRIIMKSNPESMGFKLSPAYPCLTDNVDSSGSFGRYIYQDSWAFSHLIEFKPEKLVDVASSTHFVAFAAQITKVESVDIRILRASMPNITSVRGDVTDLPFENESVEAISTLSVIEHVGLGRYGDNLDINGMQNAILEIKRVLKKNGILLVAFPVGIENIISFNAHRICTPEWVYKMFEGFKLVDEKYALSDRIIDKDHYDQLGRPYSYGCYRFKK